MTQPYVFPSSGLNGAFFTVPAEFRAVMYNCGATSSRIGSIITPCWSRSKEGGYLIKTFLETFGLSQYAFESTRSIYQKLYTLVCEWCIN